MLKRAFALSDQGLRKFDTDHSSKFVVDGSNDAFRKSGRDSC